MWKGPKKPMDKSAAVLGKVSLPAAIPRMWTCTKCSYAYNPMWVEHCDICESNRITASLTQPNLITLTKNGEEQGGKDNMNNNVSKLVMSKSTHGFDELPTSMRVPMATFEQDLEDDFQFMPGKFNFNFQNSLIRIRIYF